MVSYSTKATMDRNATIFWAFFMSSMLIGPMYVFFSWHGKSTIEDKDRLLLYTMLTAFAGASVIIFAFLKKPDSQRQSRFDPRQAWNALKDALIVAKEKRMILLMVPFAYTGFVVSMYNLVLPTAVGSTESLPNAKSMVGLVGLLVGTGEICGALGWGALIKLAPRWSRGFIILFSLCCHCIAYLLIFLAIPSNSVLNDSTAEQETYIMPTETIIAITAVTLGLGDSGFNTQIMGVIGLLYKDDSTPAFALYKFAQSFTAAVGFFYASVLGLQWQLLIQVIFAFAGTCCFLTVEYKMDHGATSYDQI